MGALVVRQTPIASSTLKRKRGIVVRLMLTGSAAPARFVTLALVLLSCVVSSARAAPAEAFDWQHGLSFVFDLKYPPDFEHFEYVNPDAPKGGMLRLASSGTWDNFNNFVDKGRDAAGLAFLAYTNLLYDRLLARAADEPTARYGLLADAVAHDPDFEWVAFRLREDARWHDGEPVTAEDVIYSFETYKEHGSVGIRTMIADVERIEQIGPRIVRYVMREGTRNPKIPLTLGDLPVLPAHYWRERDPSKTTLEPPLGSGPYRIKDFDVGRYVVWERVPDYWGRDLPVNRGRWNFDTIKWDYFRDENVQREAHKSGILDVRQETVAKAWAVSYEQVPAMQRGLMKKELLELARPSGLWWAIFWNLRKERFQDIRVRKALSLLYNFEWINNVQSYGFYDDGRSVFQGSVMAHRGPPSDAELELLEPWRDQLPPEVFEREYESVHPDDMSEVRAR
ncbi:MAG: extracellular solute-binding protein [Gammaproteobacteria bacterium]|nr:extracellular solute-binding protein [Gammaproteobacteria bacterium]